MVVQYKNHTKHEHNQSAEYMKAERRDIYSNHCAIKGLIIKKHYFIRQLASLFAQFRVTAPQCMPLFHIDGSKVCTFYSMHCGSY